MPPHPGLLPRGGEGVRSGETRDRNVPGTRRQECLRHRKERSEWHLLASFGIFWHVLAHHLKKGENGQKRPRPTVQLPRKLQGSNSEVRSPKCEGRIEKKTANIQAPSSREAPTSNIQKRRWKIEDGRWKKVAAKRRAVGAKAGDERIIFRRGLVCGRRGGGFRGFLSGAGAC